MLNFKIVKKMKRVSFLGLMVSLFLVSAPLVQSQNVAANSTHYVIDFQKLSHYLELDDFQKNGVYEINSFFIDQQNQYIRKNLSPEKLEKNWNHVLYGNLKLMKETLTAEQYQKYLRLLNTTNNNRMLAAAGETDSHDEEWYLLAEFKTK
jgi:hypothetical protein